MNYQNKLSEFRAAVTPASSVLILTHDYPDPDSLASAYGISELLASWGVTSPVVSFGGFVGRAENKAMVRCLKIPIIPLVLANVGDFEKIILVDCYPGRGNVSLPTNIPIHAVIDHHPNDVPPNTPFFHDIRPEYGATTTIITRYLLEADCPIPPKMATLLFNGIKTDTGGILRDAIEDDIDCYKRLFDIMDHRLLSKIENPNRDAEFYRILHTATETAVCYKDVGYTHIGAVKTPDSVAEMAEFLHRWEKLEWMTCTGIFKSQIFFSMRSETDDMAGIYAERLATQFGGSGGGHAKAAAGRIPILEGGIETMLDKIELAIKEIFGVTDVDKETLLQLSAPS